MLLFVQIHVSAATIVHLDEIEVPVLEIQVAVLFLVAGKAHAYAPRMAVLGAAGIVASVAVDTCFQPKAVDVVHEWTHAVGEQLRVQAQVSVFTSSIPVAVVDVHILVARRLQSAFVHGVGLSFDELLVDVEGECVPRAPSHGGCALGVGC